MKARGWPAIAFGGTLWILLGASAAQARSLSSIFSNVQRNDIYDASIGFRYLFLESGVVSANFLVPLNDEGLRTDFIPTVEVEYAFSAPWRGTGALFSSFGCSIRPGTPRRRRPQRSPRRVRMEEAPEFLGSTGRLTLVAEQAATDAG